VKNSEVEKQAGEKNGVAIGVAFHAGLIQLYDLSCSTEPQKIIF
jgi:hypothetical protein